MDDSALFSANRQIVLISPDALSPDFKPEQLGGFVDAEGVRCIVRADDARGLAFAAAARQAKLAVEVLLGCNAPEPDEALRACSARMPPGRAPSLKADGMTSDADYLALLMSDAIFVDGGGSGHSILVAAGRLGKPRVSRIAEARAGVAASPQSRLLRLDPLRPATSRSLATRLWRCIGRFELRCMSIMTVVGLVGAALRREDRESVDFDDPAPPPGFAKASKAFWSTLKLRWDCSAWFAPLKEWQEMIPDAKARAKVPTSAIPRFETLDRAALLSARASRDVTWIIHFAAVAAVVFAALGAVYELEIDLGPCFRLPVWPMAEVVALIGFVLLPWLVISRANLYPRWMGARLGAEQIRAACLSLPLLLLPSSFAAKDEAEASDNSEAKYRNEAMNLAKRAIRDHGLPFRPPTSDLKAATAWVSLIVDDQISYHRRNFRTLEDAEHGLKLASTFLFILVLAAVALHFWRHDWKLLLVATTGGPALAAAFHALATRLDMINRIHLSRDVYTILRGIRDSLTDLAGQADTEGSWTDLRKVALDAADAIASENERWHRLIQLQAPELP